MQRRVCLERELPIGAHIFVALMERRVPLKISPRRAYRLVAGNAWEPLNS
jgi:hypothetical protein